MLLQGSSVGVWIGLWDEDPDTWTSGKKVSYTNWSPVSPRSFLNVSSCEMIQVDLHCCQKHDFVVYFDYICLSV